MTFFRLGLASLVLALAGPASAQIVPVSQERAVIAFAEAEDGIQNLFDSGSEGAPDFAPFSTFVTASVSQPGVNLLVGARQRSSLSATAITATGSAGGVGIAAVPPWNTNSQGISQFRVTFQVTEASSFELSGLLQERGTAGSGVTLERGPFNLLYAVSASEETLAFSESGTLDPGSYTLTVNCNGSAVPLGPGVGSGVGFAAFDLTLALTPLGG